MLWAYPSLQPDPPTDFNYAEEWYNHRIWCHAVVDWHHLSPSGLRNIASFVEKWDWVGRFSVHVGIEITDIIGRTRQCFIAMCSNITYFRILKIARNDPVGTTSAEMRSRLKVVMSLQQQYPIASTHAVHSVLSTTSVCSIRGVSRNASPRKFRSWVMMATTKWRTQRHMMRNLAGL
jgi:hypothetical protein